MKDMKINNLKNHKFFIKSLLLTAVSLAFISCSNLFGDNLPENPSTERPETIKITGQITISEELAASCAVPEEYRSFFASLTKADERSAFPTAPADGEYIITATAEGKTAESINITTEDGVTSYSIILPIDETNTSWTITAEYKASFNGSTVKILILTDTFTDTFSYNNPSFTHNFQLKPLTSGNGNIELEITYETSGTADELELYFGETKINADTEAGEEISPSVITLKNRTAGTYNAKLVYKKSGYVVFTDYQGITVFPNMTTNKWINSVFNSSSPSPITSTNTYKVTDALVSAYKLTQIFVGTITVAGVEITGSDDTGNGTVFAPYATLSKAINYLITSGNSGTPYTIWIGGEVTGSTTIQDGTSSAASVKAESLTLSGFNNDNTKDKLKAGSSGSVLLVDTSVPVTITNLTITGGKGTSTVIYNTTSKLCGGGLNIKSGSVTLTTGTQISGNSSAFGGGVYVASGAKLFMSGNSVVGELITNNTTTASAENYTTFTNCANYATEYGGGIYVNGGELYIGYSNVSTVDTDFTGGVNRNLCPTNSIPQDAWGGGIYYKGPCFKMAKGTVSYNYAKMSGGGITIYGDNTVFDFSGGSIEKNTAGNEGGGLYLNSAKVYMHGTAIIGDTGTTMTQTADFSNKATSTNAIGGGFYMEGSSANLYLGYKTPATEGGDPVADASFTGGICHNYSAKYAGGLYHNGGQVKINKGEISYNKAENNGGGAYLSGSLSMTGGNFTSNACGENGSGGALYCVCSYGTYNMSGGTFTTNTCGSNGNGGAVYYSAGTFNYSGSLSFPSGSLRNNDMYISNSKTITIAGNSISGNAKITPSTWTRGTQIFAPGSGITITDDMLSQFSLTDNNWSIVKVGSSTSATGKIECDKIYVAGTDKNSLFTNSPSDDTGDGTVSKPYASIGKAASQCWHSGTDYRIIVSGKITGSAQSIPSTVTTGKAKTITIEGYESNNLDKINRALTAAPTDSTSGTALTISTQVPVTITNLTITGGYASGSSADDKSGGGIKIAAGSQVILDTGAIIENNYAQLYGGGVFLSGTNAKLTVKTGAMIGKTSSNSADSDTNRSNYAGQHGGGICADNGANVIISGGTISYNFAGAYGGGLAVKASSTTESTASISGSPSITRCGGYYGGGALYVSGNGSNNKKSTVSMTGGTINNCYSSSSYSSIQISESGVLELGGSVSIPYSDSDTKNYIYLTCAGWSQNGSLVYGIGSIKFISELSNHNSSNKIKVYVQGTQDDYKNLADITALSSGLLTSELPNIDINNSLTGYAQQLFAKDTTLDSTGKSAYYRHYRGTKLPTATKGIGYIMFNDGSSTPYSANLSLHNDQKAAAVAVIFKTSGSKAYGVGLKQEQTGYAWSSDEDAIALLPLEDSYNENNGKTCMQAIKDRAVDLIGSAFSSTTFPAMWWASHYEDIINNEGIYTSGWYLPAKNELKAVYDNKSKIDSVITLLTSTYADSYITASNLRFYWSATNASDAYNGNVWCVDFSEGSASGLMAPTGRSSVAIREF